MDAVAGVPRREVQAVGLITVAHSLSHLYMLALVPLAVGGGLRGLVNASRDVSVRRVAGEHSIGTAFAFVTTGFLLGQAIAPPIYGYLIDLGEPETVFWASAAFSLISVATILIARQRI